MRDGNTLLLSLMLSEMVENHPSFILGFLNTKKFVLGNKPTCGNLSHDWLYISNTVQWRGKRDKDRIREKAQVILLKFPVWVWWTPQMGQKFAYSSCWKQIFSFSKHQHFREFPINVCPDKEQSYFTGVAATNCKCRWETARASVEGWEISFRIFSGSVDIFCLWCIMQRRYQPCKSWWCWTGTIW